MAVPYVWKEFPRTLHKPDGITRSVVSDDEKAEALSEGWSLVPFVDLTGNRFDRAAGAPATSVEARTYDAVQAHWQRKKGTRA